MAAIFRGVHSMFTYWSRQLPPQRTPGRPSSIQSSGPILHDLYQQTTTFIISIAEITKHRENNQSAIIANEQEH
jgi:hypothetical protein